MWNNNNDVIKACVLMKKRIRKKHFWLDANIEKKLKNSVSDFVKNLSTCTQVYTAIIFF